MTETVAAPSARETASAPRSSAPRWQYPALAVLLIGTAAAYCWNLTAGGWANEFYAAAVQSGVQSWKAFLFGSLDPGNIVTVDKTPLSLWPMEISGRIFGFSSGSMLAPEVALGVGSVALLWATVRRVFGPGAGLLAGLVLAVTPVAAWMFRYNNPDATLTFLIIGAAYAMTRALEGGRGRSDVVGAVEVAGVTRGGASEGAKSGRAVEVAGAVGAPEAGTVTGSAEVADDAAAADTARAAGRGVWGWMVLCGACIGLGFLAKQLQVMLVVPGLAAAYLVAGGPRLRVRIGQLCAAGVGVLVSAGWWVLIAQLWPADSRPYFGGSQNNSILDLTLGYNGIQRLDTSGFGPRAGTPGIARLFGPALAGQITWLVPAALVLLVAGIALRGRIARTDPVRGALLMWGGWLVVAGLVFSFMNGTFHQYYTLTMAPAIAALIGGGGVLVWRERGRASVRAALVVSVLLTVGMAWMTLSRTPDFVPWLRWAVLVVGVVAAAVLAVPMLDGLPNGRLSAAALGAAVAVGLAGPVAYTVDTLHNSGADGFGGAGPQVPGANMFGGPPPGGRGGHGPGGARPGVPGPGGTQPGAQAPGGTQPGAQVPGGTQPGAQASGGTQPGAQVPGGTQPGAQASGGTQPGAQVPGGTRPGVQGVGARPGAAPDGQRGGPGRDDGPSAQVVSLLKAGADKYTWAGAAVSSHGANSYQLASGVPVMSIGGFSGGDPAPTLAQFQKYVAQGRIHYFIDGGGFHGPDSDSDTESAKIAAWVQQHYAATTVDGSTLYDLSAPAH